LTLSAVARIQTRRGLRAAAPLPANQSARRNRMKKKAKKEDMKKGGKKGK